MKPNTKVPLRATKPGPRGPTPRRENALWDRSHRPVYRDWSIIVGGEAHNVRENTNNITLFNRFVSERSSITHRQRRLARRDAKRRHVANIMRGGCL